MGCDVYSGRLRATRVVVMSTGRVLGRSDLCRQILRTHSML